MKPKLILGLALALAGDWFGCSAIAQNFSNSGRGDDFQIPPPITNADPSIRCSVSIRVPTKLIIQRTSDGLSVTIDTNSFESTNLMVGTNMVTGINSQINIYPEGESPPANDWGRPMSDRLNFYSGICYWHIKKDRFPLPGKKYVVEIDLLALETDVPAQHFWDPYGKNFKVLWQRTLKQTIE